MERRKLMLINNGFSIEESDLDNTVLIGTHTTSDGRKVVVYWGSNGTMMIQKPNGTHKNYVDKTDAQCGAVFKQLLSFWG